MMAETNSVKETRPTPDPTVLTTEQLLREVTAAKDIMGARMDGIDSTLGLLQAHMSGRQAAIDSAIHHLNDVFTERFASIAIQFIERDKRTDQLSIADKTAIAAALQAQKEAAGATNESNSVSNIKMETNFTKLIEQGQTLLQTVMKNTEAQINDLKSRLDKGEGRTSISDPATTDVLKQLTIAVSNLDQTRNESKGRTKAMDDGRAYLVAFGAMIVTAIAIVGFILHH
jgi:hypothetical protein